MTLLFSILSWVGMVYTSYLLLKFLRLVYIYTRSSSIKRYHHSDGDKQPWALVTGASDGIGLAISHELAHEDFNVILHGRNLKKLEGVKNQLSKRFPHLSFRIAIADAGSCGPETIRQIDEIVKSLDDINVTVLVNNVGGQPPGMIPPLKTFDKNTPSNIDTVIAMNLRFTTQLTSAMLPHLLRNQPSLIMSIGSMAEGGYPWISMYSGSKSFLMTWSLALAREMKAERRDVEVLGIVAGKVTSVSFSKEPATFTIPSATNFAKAALDRVGCGQVVVAGYWVHAVLRMLPGILPEFIFSKVSANAIREESARLMTAKRE